MTEDELIPKCSLQSQEKSAKFRGATQPMNFEEENNFINKFG